MQLIDTHQHVIYRAEHGYDWADGIPELAGQDFTFDDYDTLTKDTGVIGTIFMETGVNDSDYMAEARFIARQMHRPRLLGQIASCRPETDAGFADWLDEGRDLNVVGYRRILHVVDDGLSQSDTFRANLRRIGAAGLPFDMCFLARQLPIAQDLARACDDQPLVLNHCGVPDIAGGAFDAWASEITRLATLDHVTLKLSGITAYCAPEARDTDTLRPWVDHVLTAFGPNRMIWGGDWPVANMGAGLPVWIDQTRALLSHLSHSEQHAIGHENATRLYGVTP